MSQHVLEKLDAIYEKLDSIERLLEEILDRPRPTIVHLSAYSKVQIERFLRILFNFWQQFNRDQQ